VARYLALDWDQQRVRVVAAAAARGQVRIEKTLAWDEPGGVNVGNAEAVGQRLRERLKAAGVAAAPVLIAAGREQVILKEVRYPRSDPAQEPALVRFQATKELTGPPDGVVIDYAPLDHQGGHGERRALLLIARKELVGACKALCKAAGLKLAAVTPRAFGVAGCPRQPAPAGADAAVAVLAASGGWAEFCVARGGSLLFARPLPGGEVPINEVRRNLALYAGQPQVTLARDAVQALYVAGDGPSADLAERLRDVLAVPVLALDPFGGQAGETAVERAAYAGAVGLVRLWSDGGKLPVNFVAPKEPKPAVNPNRPKFVIAAGLALLALILVGFAGMVMARERQEEVEQLKAQKVALENKIKELQPDLRNLAALNEWGEGAVPVLDELYDLSAHFPWKVGFKVTQLSLAPAPKVGGKGAKQVYQARITIKGQVPRDDERLVHDFVASVNRDKHNRAVIESIKQAGGEGAAATARAVKEFVLHVDVRRRPPERYTTVLQPPPRPQTPAAAEDQGDGEGFLPEGLP
jgi:Tfp pilus assembly PilM family ATPase